MDEYLDVINEKNEIIGKELRSECHKKGLWHRGVHIILINNKGEFLLQKRSMKKDLYPGWWSDSAAGHVGSGETCHNTAMREVKEEIGIETHLKEIMTFKKTWSGNVKIDNEFITFFIGHSEGPFNIDKEEVEKVKFFSLDEVKEMIKKEKFTPAAVIIFEEINKNPDILKI